MPAKPRRGIKRILNGIISVTNKVIFYHEGKELATSVVSNVKHALGLKTNKPANQAQCTKEYWAKTIQVVGVYYDLPAETIQAAINSHQEYVSDRSL